MYLVTVSSMAFTAAKSYFWDFEADNKQPIAMAMALCSFTMGALCPLLEFITWSMQLRPLNRRLTLLYSAAGGGGGGGRTLHTAKMHRLVLSLLGKQHHKQSHGGAYSMRGGDHGGGGGMMMETAASVASSVASGFLKKSVVYSSDEEAYETPPSDFDETDEVTPAAAAGTAAYSTTSTASTAATAAANAAAVLVECERAISHSLRYLWDLAASDSGWQHVTAQDGVIVSSRSTSKLSSKKNSGGVRHIFKAEGLVFGRPADVARLVMSAPTTTTKKETAEWNTSGTTSEILQRLDHCTNLVRTQWCPRVSGLLGARDFIEVRRTSRHLGCYLMGTAGIELPEYPDRAGCVRALAGLGGYIVYPMPNQPNASNLCWIMAIDMRTPMWVPNSLIERSLVSMMVSCHEDVRSYLERIQSARGTDPTTAETDIAATTASDTTTSMRYA